MPLPYLNLLGVHRDRASAAVTARTYRTDEATSASVRKVAPVNVANTNTPTSAGPQTVVVRAATTAGVWRQAAEAISASAIATSAVNTASCPSAARLPVRAISATTEVDAV